MFTSSHMLTLTYNIAVQNFVSGVKISSLHPRPTPPLPIGIIASYEQGAIGWRNIALQECEVQFCTLLSSDLDKMNFTGNFLPFSKSAVLWIRQLCLVLRHCCFET